jgi:hypothetical protein
MRRPLGGLILGMLYLLLGRAAGAEQYPEYEWQMGKELVRICQSQSPGDVAFARATLKARQPGEISDIASARALRQSRFEKWSSSGSARILRNGI